MSYILVTNNNSNQT